MQEVKECFLMLICAISKNGCFLLLHLEKYQVVPVCKGRSEGVNKQGIKVNEDAGAHETGFTTV